MSKNAKAPVTQQSDPKLLEKGAVAVPLAKGQTPAQQKGAPPQAQAQTQGAAKTVTNKKPQSDSQLLLQQKYFSNLIEDVEQINQKSELILKNCQNVIQQIDAKNINKVMNGRLHIEGIMFRKGIMIEGDQVDQQLLEAFKERDSINSQLAMVQHFIKDSESSLTAVNRKTSNIVEDAMTEKRIQEFRKQKEDLEKRLFQEEKKIKSLQSQRIDNPKSAYGHPGLRAYLEEHESMKIKEVNHFIKRIKEERKIFDENQQKKEKVLANKHMQEEQDRLAKEARLKIQKEKEKEQHLAERIKEIEEGRIKRKADSEEHEQKYKSLKEKLNSGSEPLFMRLNKEYISQVKSEEDKMNLNIQQHRESNKKYELQNLSEHQEKYLDKLKAQQEERLNEQKRQRQISRDYLLKVSQFPSSTKWQQIQEEDTAPFFSPQDHKLRAQKIMEARNHFAEGVKHKKKLHIDKEKRFEMEMKIDKLNNPLKYVKPLKKRRNSVERNDDSDDSSDHYDEKVFKKQITVERGLNNQYALGKQYLEQVKESVAKIPKRSRSEHPLSQGEQTLDSITEGNKNLNVSSVGLSKSVMMKQKPHDYMAEIRTKFNLDKKHNNLLDWEKVSRSSNNLDPSEKKKHLLRISEKLDQKAKHQELLLNIHSKNRPGKLTLEDVDERERIDDMYLESIKAKLAIFQKKHVHESDDVSQD